MLGFLGWLCLGRQLSPVLNRKDGLSGVSMSPHCHKHNTFTFSTQWASTNFHASWVHWDSVLRRHPEAILLEVNEATRNSPSRPTVPLDLQTFTVNGGRMGKSMETMGRSGWSSDQGKVWNSMYSFFVSLFSLSFFILQWRRRVPLLLPSWIPLSKSGLYGWEKLIPLAHFSNYHR